MQEFLRLKRLTVKAFKCRNLVFAEIVIFFGDNGSICIGRVLCLKVHFDFLCTELCTDFLYRDLQSYVLIEVLYWLLKKS